MALPVDETVTIEYWRKDSDRKKKEVLGEKQM
jgi:hypothetical protein